MVEPVTAGKRWIRIDLHIHTPASEDYAERDATFLDILHEAERHNLEIIAITDHNTVAGYEQLRRSIDFLEQLVRMERATAADQEQYDEYMRLLRKIAVLPGFEFTSHYGAHVLGVFPPQTPISLIEATLLQLGVPADRIKAGATSVPNTEHVTDAYEVIDRAGGLVIAAHVNGAAGVISESLRMGASGQSRIAATQSPHLHALEFVNFYTDHGTFTSPGFFNGRTEHYERRMFCIQGSDAHRIRRAPSGSDASYRHGIGDRYFEALLDAPTFNSLRDLFRSQRFDHVRVPKRDQKEWEIDQLRFGVPSERNILRGRATGVADLLCDVVALANMGGGTLVVGAASSENRFVEGVPQPDQISEQLRLATTQAVEPAPSLSFELMRYEGGNILRVEVRAPHAPPYMTQDGAIYVRRDGQTTRANRGEILQLARRALAEGATSPLDNGQELPVPRSGVEVVDAQRRNGEWQYEIRDLRTTPGVVRDRAQGLWAYAIDRYEDLRQGRVDLQSQIKWAGRLGLWRSYRQGNRTKYDLVHRDANGVIDHVFYGVSDWGLNDAWAVLLEGSRPAAEPPEEAPVADNAPAELVPPPAPPAGVNEAAPEHTFADRIYRWQGNVGIWRITRGRDGEPLFDLAIRGAGDNSVQELTALTGEQMNERWLKNLVVSRPRTGIEVVSDTIGEDSIRRISFRDLRTGDVSAPWRVDELKEGSVREYAARQVRQDLPLDEHKVRWWGNMGYLRPMRSQVDLVYRDEHGVDHIYYAARREELRDEWRALLDQWDAAPPSVSTFERPPAAQPPPEPMARAPEQRLRPELEEARRVPERDVWDRERQDGNGETPAPGHVTIPDEASEL